MITTIYASKSNNLDNSVGFHNSDLKYNLATILLIVRFA